MATVIRFCVFMILLGAQATAFTPHLAKRNGLYTELQVSLRPSSTHVRKSTNVLEDFMEQLFSVFPSVLSPSGWKGDAVRTHKLVDNPKNFRSPASISAWNKSNKKRSYHAIDVNAEFLRYWGIDPNADYKKKAQILSELNELADSLVAPLSNVYSTDGDALGFAGDGVRTAFSAMKTDLDKEHVVKEPKRHFAGVKMSNLRKTLRADPNYFSH